MLLGQYCFRPWFWHRKYDVICKWNPRDFPLADRLNCYILPWFWFIANGDTQRSPRGHHSSGLWFAPHAGVQFPPCKAIVTWAARNTVDHPSPALLWQGPMRLKANPDVNWQCPCNTLCTDSEVFCMYSGTTPGLGLMVPSLVWYDLLEYLFLSFYICSFFLLLVIHCSTWWTSMVGECLNDCKIALLITMRAHGHEF